MSKKQIRAKPKSHRGSSHKVNNKKSPTTLAEELAFEAMREALCRIHKQKFIYKGIAGYTNVEHSSAGVNVRHMPLNPDLDETELTSQAGLASEPLLDIFRASGIEIDWDPNVFLKTNLPDKYVDKKEWFIGADSPLHPTHRSSKPLHHKTLGETLDYLHKKFYPYDDSSNHFYNGKLCGGEILISWDSFGVRILLKPHNTQNRGCVTSIELARFPKKMEKAPSHLDPSLKDFKNLLKYFKIETNFGVSQFSKSGWTDRFLPPSNSKPKSVSHKRSQKDPPKISEKIRPIHRVARPSNESTDSIQVSVKIDSYDGLTTGWSTIEVSRGDFEALDNEPGEIAKDLFLRALAIEFNAPQLWSLSFMMPDSKALWGSAVFEIPTSTLRNKIGILQEYAEISCFHWHVNSFRAVLHDTNVILNKVHIK